MRVCMCVSCVMYYTDDGPRQVSFLSNSIFLFNVNCSPSIGTSHIGSGDIVNSIGNIDSKSIEQIDFRNLITN